MSHLSHWKLYLLSENEVCKTTFITTGPVVKEKPKNIVVGLFGFWLSNKLVILFALFLFFKISDICNISKYYPAVVVFSIYVSRKAEKKIFPLFLQPQNVLSQVLFGSVGLAQPWCCFIQMVSLFRWNILFPLLFGCLFRAHKILRQILEVGTSFHTPPLNKVVLLCDD